MHTAKYVMSTTQYTPPLHGAKYDFSCLLTALLWSAVRYPYVSTPSRQSKNCNLLLIPDVFTSAMALLHNLTRHSRAAHSAALLFVSRCVSDELVCISNTHVPNVNHSLSLILTASAILGQGMTNTPCPDSISLAESRTKQNALYKFLNSLRSLSFHDSFLSWAVVKDSNS